MDLISSEMSKTSENSKTIHPFKVSGKTNKDIWQRSKGRNMYSIKSTKMQQDAICEHLWYLSHNPLPLSSPF